MEIQPFPNKLKMFRRRYGYSQKKVARLLGLKHTSTLSRWEHGMSLPTIVQVFRLAQLYNAAPTELFKELWSNSANDLLAPQEEPIITH